MGVRLSTIIMCVILIIPSTEQDIGLGIWNHPDDIMEAYW